MSTDVEKRKKDLLQDLEQILNKLCNTFCTKKFNIREKAQVLSVGEVIDLCKEGKAIIKQINRRKGGRT